MTIHRTRGDITFECDGCDETIETGESEGDRDVRLLTLHDHKGLR